MIGIIDYGMGNLRSVQKAFELLGAGAVVLGEPNRMDPRQAVVTSILAVPTPPTVAAMKPGCYRNPPPTIRSLATGPTSYRSRVSPPLPDFRRSHMQALSDQLRDAR